MRVSKVVKEYIRKKVNAVYEPRINEIDLEYKCAKEKVNMKLRSLTEQFKEQSKAIVADSCDTWNFEQKYWSYGTDVCDPEAEKEYRHQRDLLKYERDNKIEEIIVELELGGNKETLEKMLAEL